MKKIISLTAAIFLFCSCYAQKNSSLSDFLNKDLTQLMQERIDSLSHQLFVENENLDMKTKELENLKALTPDIVRLSIFFYKLENNLPLSRQDSIMLYQQPPTMFINGQVYSLIMQNDSAVLNNFPRVKQMIAEQKLLLEPLNSAGASAPAIELPPMSSVTGSKRRIADAWLQYIYDLSSRCNFSKDEVNEYLKIEKLKVPNGNLDKLIDLRQKFSLFIQEKCKQ